MRRHSWRLIGRQWVLFMPVDPPALTASGAVSEQMLSRTRGYGITASIDGTSWFALDDLWGGDLYFIIAGPRVPLRCDPGCAVTIGDLRRSVFRNISTRLGGEW